jgi:hypothetical protein
LLEKIVMKTKSLPLLILLTLLFSSCSYNFSLQKRRYGKGYYFSKNTQQSKTHEGLRKIDVISDEKNVTLQHLAVTECDKSKSDRMDRPSIRVSFPEKGQSAQIDFRNLAPHQPAQEMSEKKLLTSASTSPFFPRQHVSKPLSLQKSSLPHRKTNHQPYPYFLNNCGGMNIFMAMGILSGLISLILALIYLAILFNVIGSIGFGSFGLALLLIFLVAAIIFAAILIINSD